MNLLSPEPTTAELLVTDLRPGALPCGCTRDHDCAHAAHLRGRPALARKLLEHRRSLSRSFGAALHLIERRELADVYGGRY